MIDDINIHYIHLKLNFVLEIRTFFANINKAFNIPLAIYKIM